MKVITVWQPWASLIAIGAKPYEFRTWYPPATLIGHRLGVHAGARPVKKDEVYQLVRALKDPANHITPCLNADLALPLLEELLDRPHSVPLSHILCTGILGKPKRGDECAKEFGLNAGNDSNREDTFNWGWPLTDLEQLIPPEPARGAQGLWNWSGK